MNETYGSVGWDSGGEVIECSDGGFAIVGYTDSYGAGNTDGWLVRTEANGDIRWNYTYGGPGYDFLSSLVECSDGGFALAGYTDSFGVTVSAFWLVRVNANGGFLWNETYDTPGSDFGEDIVEMSTGGFAITGFTSGFGGDLDIWLVGTDTSGNHLWNQSYGSIYSDLAYSVIEVSSGGFLLTGHKPTTHLAARSRFTPDDDLWIVRTNGTGHMLWDRTFDAGSYEYGSYAVECSDGGFAVSGSVINYGTLRSDYWLIRTDDTGAHQWNETYGWSDGREVCRELIAYSSGGFVLAGDTNRTSDGNTDFWVVYTDDSGTQLWNESYGGPDNDSCHGLADCSLGIAVSGFLNFSTPNYEQGWLFVIPDQVAPTWDPAPADQTAIAGVSFSYDLNATDAQGLAAWTLNDTTTFAIDADGVVTNTVALGIGTYGLYVTVSDPAGNTLTGTFMVTVQPPPPAIPGFPVTAIAIGVAAALGLGLAKRRRRQI